MFVTLAIARACFLLSRKRNKKDKREATNDHETSDDQDEEDFSLISSSSLGKQKQPEADSLQSVLVQALHTDVNCSYYHFNCCLVNRWLMADDRWLLFAVLCRMLHC